jgi:hypothetical protein
MSPAMNRLNRWANGEADDAAGKGLSTSQAGRQKSSAGAKVKTSLLRRLSKWVNGEATFGEYPASPIAASAKPAPATPFSTGTKPAAPKPASASAQPSAAAKPNINADSELAAGLASRLAELQNGLGLTQLNQQVQQAQNHLNHARVSLRDCRTRGYIFQKNLETTISELETQASGLRDRLTEQVRSLKAEAGELEILLAKNVSAARGSLMVLENKVKAAVSAVQGECQRIDGRAQEINASVKKIVWTLHQLEQASFSLTASEAVVDATQALWKRGGSSDVVKGIFYLTDLRIIFEQKDEKATKKILFITTETEKHQKLEWEAPIELVEKAVHSQQGLFGIREQLVISCAPGGPYSQATLQLDGTDEIPASSSAWAALIGRVKSGLIAQDRTVPLDVQTFATNIPSRCPSCGALFNQKILRGQREITCQYCGLQQRL